MNRYPDLHKPVFTILDNAISPNSNRRIADLDPLRPSIAVTAVRKMLAIVEYTFGAANYRPVEPCILFNVGPVLSQEPHEDGPVESDEFPTLSVLLNPLGVMQGVWIAARSHLGDRSYMARETIPPGHAIVLRHDTCHAGMSLQNETKLLRAHVNLVHMTDARELFDFSQIVMATIRAPNGHRIRLPANEFNHVLQFVNRANEPEGQDPSLDILPQMSASSGL